MYVLTRMDVVCEITEMVGINDWKFRFRNRTWRREVPVEVNL